MSNFFVIAIHETNEVFFVKSTDLDAFLMIELIDKISVFDNHHPSCFARMK